ncbi:helix-turn-helix domain-containing protein [Streptomyces sp. ET3-23]|uniref:helix-turn-helix domain-containing protein n=1 Tax=Streptomyces sp. ET3-23 TaxID=2885643 RepID=UPI001D10D497|nr:helix-turn-helix transcriptional regulator [Streptomyces sp. ET3-23]MCC2280854.1 helix-turn-helix domain-containing protein [Streptomyces sp. ET3-23]
MSPRSNTTGPSSLERGSAALFGTRLQRLADTTEHYSDAEIAMHVGVTTNYIAKLRAGRSMPSFEKGRAIAAFFNVHVDYLLQPDDHPAVQQVEQRLQELVHRRSGSSATNPAVSPAPGDDDETLWQQLQEVHGVREIAMRAGQLSPGARAAVLDIVNRILGSESSTATTEQKTRES